MLHEKLLERIKSGMEGQNIGLSTGIEKLDKTIYGLQKAWFYTVISGTGGGKSSFAINSCIYQPLKQMLGDDRLRIIYFSLELSQEVLLAKLLSLYIYDTYDVVITYEQMLSMKGTLDSELYKYINMSIPWLEQVNKHLIIYDKGLNASRMYAFLMSHFEERGEFIEISESKSIYKHKYEDHFTITIIDHVRLLESKGPSPKPEIDLMCKYLITLRNRCGLTPVCLQQINRGSMDMERKKANMQEFNLSDLSDTSDTAQASEVVLGLFYPHREKMSTCRGYKVENGLGGRLRIMQLLKNRYGQSDLAFGVGFYGETNYFDNLPTSKEMTDSDYIKYSEIKNLRKKDSFIKVDQERKSDDFTFTL
jgi:replicative DNA helicase